MECGKEGGGVVKGQRWDKPRKGESEGRGCCDVEAPGFWSMSTGGQQAEEMIQGGVAKGGDRVGLNGKSRLRPDGAAF